MNKAMTSATGATGGFVLNKKDDNQDGVMVAFRIPPEIGSHLLTLAQGAGLGDDCLMSLNDLHVTLAYLGNINEQGFGAPDEEALYAELQKFAANHGEIGGSLNGVGRFVDAPDKDCIYINFDSPALPVFRAALVEFLTSVGCTVADTHGYTPHMTLAYIDKNAPMPSIPLQPIAVTFSGLWEAYGDAGNYDIPFAAAVKSEKAVSKDVAGYTEHASNPAERCHLCKHFIQGGACQLVEGQINPDGWCKYFERRTEGARAMPYKIVKSKTDKKYRVLNVSSGDKTPKEGYTSRAEAINYLRALESNVPDAHKTSVTGEPGVSLDGDDDSILIHPGMDIIWIEDLGEDDEEMLWGKVVSVANGSAEILGASGNTISKPLNELEPMDPQDDHPEEYAGGTATSAKHDKKPHGEQVNETDLLNDPAYNTPTESLSGTMSAEDEGQHYAYPDGKKLPMPDAGHVILAAASFGPKPPHGNHPDIPTDKVGEVKGRIRARAHELGLGQDEMAKVNAYLSGRMPKNISEKDAGAWATVYARALQETGDETKAALAAQGAINRATMIGTKAVNGLPTHVEGWAMLFSDEDNPDLQGTFFDDSTRTLLDLYPRAPLWMEHGKNALYGATPVGWRTNAQVYPRGVWLEHDFDTNHPLYPRTAQDAADGKFSYSSDSIRHYAEEGFDPASGHLGEWPLAGCSLTRTPAEPGLGPVFAKSLGAALKSAVQEREATDAQGDSSPTTINKSEDIQMDPMDTTIEGENGTETFDEPQEESEVLPGSTLEALASMYGCEAEPEAVRSAMDDHIAQMSREGHADPELCKTLGVPDTTPPEHVANHLNNLYSAAMTGNKDDMPATPEPAMAAPVRPNYGVLQRHLASHAAKSAARMPAFTNQRPAASPYAAKGVNVNKGLKVPGVLETVSDMIRVKQGLPPKFRWNSRKAMEQDSFAAKAMTSASGPTGGYVLRQEVSEEVIDPLRANPVCFKLGAQEVDMQGYNVKMVPAMQTAPRSRWIGENQQLQTSQPAYRMISLFPHGLEVTVPIPVNVEANLTPRAEAQIKEQMSLSQTLAIDIAALTGMGGADANNPGAQPTGILNTPGVRRNLLATNGRIPNYQDIVYWESLLNKSNVPLQGNKRGMAMHSDVLEAFTGQTDTLGRPLVRASWADAAELTLAGYKYEVENQIPTDVVTGTDDASSYVFYGDWRYLMIGLSDMVELRLEETFMQNLQVGLLAYIYCDVKVVYPEAFIVATGVDGAAQPGGTLTTN